MSPQRYRWHRCRSRHLSGASFAQCAFPNWIPIRGNGQWVVLSRCLISSISLHGSKAAAVAELQRIDAEKCDMGCSLQHELGFIDLLQAQPDISPRPSEVA
ncbi:hypothetical protein [Amnibacterium setariae]|uniref:Uncharacterized protein n=1 Tax=Amnibacterium setariae TaxID=2306585 RepID=A0A3A1TTR4_9MICO|nr:hypothetical protein [Amnibacterium setariae]RIX26471.1 hypothetical protein D1781_16175 [Amnibacterium setariae]